MRHRRRSDGVTSAGWLYADLLLGLAMLFLVGNSLSQPKLVECPPPPPPCPPPRACPEPEPCPAPVECLPLTLGLDTTPDEISIRRLDKQSVRQAVEKRLGGRPTRRAGVVLTFGRVDGENRGTGLAKAQQVNLWLQQLYPHSFGAVRLTSGAERGTVMRDFLSFTTDYEATLEIYWFND